VAAAGDVAVAAGEVVIAVGGCNMGKKNTWREGRVMGRVRGTLGQLSRVDLKGEVVVSTKRWRRG